MTNHIISDILPTYFPLTDRIHNYYGALEVKNFAVARYLAEEDNDVYIFAPRGSSTSHKNITILSGNYDSWTGTPHPYDLEKDLIEENIDVLKQSDAIYESTHFHYMQWLKAQHPNEYPRCVWDFDHHPDNLQSLPPSPQNIICISKWQMSVLREKFKNNGHSFWQAYSGLILENYPSDFDSRDKEKNLYLFLARISSVKSPHIVLELARENPTDNFVILGDVLFTNEPHYAQKIKNIADDLDNVKVIFNCSYKEKIDYLKKATGILHPGFWNGPLEWDILEGLYFGAKALCFDRGATREIYKNEKHGLIVPFSNSEQNNIEMYKRAFKKFKNMRIDPQTCRDRILQEFDFKKKSFPIYKRVLFGDSK